MRWIISITGSNFTQTIFSPLFVWSPFICGLKAQQSLPGRE